MLLNRIEVQIGAPAQLFNDADDALGPGNLARGGADQVLPDLDDGVGKAAHRAVLPHAVAF